MSDDNILIGGFLPSSSPTMKTDAPAYKDLQQDDDLLVEMGRFFYDKMRKVKMTTDAVECARFVLQIRDRQAAACRTPRDPVEG